MGFMIPTGKAEVPLKWFQEIETSQVPNAPSTDE